MHRSILAALVLAVLLTSLDGGKTAAAPPLKAAGRIAFSVDTGIASMNPDGSGGWGGRVLLPGDTQPAWSPDGTRLAVATRWRGNEGIRLDNPDGSTIRMLTITLGDSSPAWSPDGTKLAFVDYGKLLVVNVDGSGRRELPTSAGYVNASPSWSPDGAKIAFSAYGDNGSDIFALDLASGAQTAVLTAATNDSWPAWSPDGTRLAFVRGGNVWSMARAGTDARKLTSDGRSSYNSPPAWQPLGPAPAGCTLWGTSGPDLLVGSEGDDLLCGLDGNDTLIGLGGNDRLDGGPGTDWLAGGMDVDVLIGGSGRDRLDARDGGPDTVIGDGDPGDYALYDKGSDSIRNVKVRQVSHNLAVWRPTTASGWSATNPPERAVDGRLDDIWNSGGSPPQWIEIDLGRRVAIGRVRLIAGEQPGGVAVLVLTRQADGTYRLLHRFDGPSVYRQELRFAPKRPWRAVRYLRIIAVSQGNGSEAWVSWLEIEAYAARAS